MCNEQTENGRAPPYKESNKLNCALSENIKERGVLKFFALGYLVFYIAVRSVMSRGRFRCRYSTLLSDSTMEIFLKIGRAHV